jgi:nitroreductase
MNVLPSKAFRPMTLLQAIRERRAVRDYRPEPVSAGLVYQLIASASWAPSAMNEQPWHFTVVTDKALLDEISRQAKLWLSRSVASMPRPAHFRDLMADESFHILYHAPVLIIISAPAKNQWATEDCALAAQNLMLAATGLGLGSCWIGFAQGWLNTPEACELLNLSNQNICVAPLVVGHPKAPPPAVARKAPAVSWVGGSAPLAWPSGDKPLHNALFHP